MIYLTAVGLTLGGSSTHLPDRPRPTTLLPPRSNGKPEATTAVYKLLMMGKKMPETCWAVFKRRAINLRDWCIWLVDLFECMMMHVLTNPKCSVIYELCNRTLKKYILIMVHYISLKRYFFCKWKNCTSVSLMLTFPFLCLVDIIRIYYTLL